MNHLIESIAWAYYPIALLDRHSRDVLPMFKMRKHLALLTFAYDAYYFIPLSGEKEAFHVFNIALVAIACHKPMVSIIIEEIKLNIV